MRVSLRQRIFWWSIGSTLMILLLAFLFVDEAFRTTVLRDQSENVATRVHLAEQIHSREIDEGLDRLGADAATPTLRAAIETGDPATIQENLELLLVDSELSWLAFSRPDGTVVAATASAPLSRLGLPETAAMVEEARFYDTGDLWNEEDALIQVYATSIYLGPVHFGALVGGEPVGAGRAQEIELAIQDRVVVVAGGSVVGASGNLTDNEKSQILQVWGADAPTGKQMDAGERVRPFSLNDTDFLGAAIELPNARGTRVGSIVTYRSLEEALAPARRLRLELLAIAFGGLVLALASSYLLSKRVTRPVNTLLRETIRLGGGNLDEPIRPEGDDEISALAAGFEQMRVSLRGARAELVRAERLSAVGRAASAIVHDIRQPVTAIQGHVTLLKMDGDDPQQREEDLAVIERELARLNAMMSELLELGRGSEAVNPTTGRISALLEEVTTSVKPLMASREISIEIENDYDGEWRLDFPRIRRVLENLVTNAAAAVGPGGRVMVRSEATPDGLRLEVQDTGPGIPEEVRDNLFEPFVTFGKKEGTGLGLAIVKTLTERNGGTIRFESSSSGTRFLLDFPRRDAA